MRVALASGGSILEPAGIGFTGQWGSFWQFPSETTLLTFPLPKPFHANPIQCFYLHSLVMLPFFSIASKNLINEVIHTASLWIRKVGHITVFHNIQTWPTIIDSLKPLFLQTKSEMNVMLLKLPGFSQQRENVEQ